MKLSVITHGSMMGSGILHIVASYDISDPKRLSKVAKVMKDFGERVLKSVFECNLAETTFQELKGRVDEILDPLEDSVRYYILCGKCLEEVDYSGRGEPFREEKDYAIV
jgi:CRISPR-associated protein Cas2